ncbi:hypothetical protein [Streptomyces nodosus]|uniref:hypothetical protein n=1 Tax=Streptomyces nodosus TaxID=40318 RepID=UPI0037F82584
MGGVAAMLSADEPPLNDLSDEPVQKLLGEIAPKVKELMEGGTLAIDHYWEGGHDRETWNRICDGLAHGAMNLMMALSTPAHPVSGTGLRAGRTGGRGHDAVGTAPAL